MNKVCIYACMRVCPLQRDIALSKEAQNLAKVFIDEYCDFPDVHIKM